MSNNDNERVSDVTRRTNFLLDAELTVCNLCGESHYTEDCRLLSEFKPVKDTPTISRARRTLPSNLKAVTLADGTTTVVASIKFDRGTHFGPFQAQLTTDLHPAVLLPLKIINKSGTDGCYLDSTDEENCNWMCLVAPASTASEQNLICYDMNQSIYFTAIRDILPGEELRVWYALYYGLKLQALPLADDSDSEDGFMDTPSDNLESKLKTRSNLSNDLGCELMESLAQHLPAHSLGARTEKDRWQCRFCDTQERNVASYAKHLMSHYRPKCGLCSRRFHSEKALARHHEKSHAQTEIRLGNNEELPDSKISSEEERCVILNDDNNSLKTPPENWIKTSREPCEISNVQTDEVDNLPNRQINLENYSGFDARMMIDKESWTGSGQEQSAESIAETNENVEKPLDDKMNLVNYNNFDTGLSSEKEKRIENDGKQVEESNIVNEDGEKLTNDTADLANYSNFDHGTDKADQVITINNISTSEIVQTQLVLAEDGSVIYHVANIPEGILTADMENLRLLLVENADDSQLQESVNDNVLLRRNVWSAEKPSVEPDQKNNTVDEREILENIRTPSKPLSNAENPQPCCVTDERSDVEVDNAVALILLNTQERDNQLEQINNIEAQQYNLPERSSEQYEDLATDVEMHSEIIVALPAPLDKDAIPLKKNFEANSPPVTEEIKELQTGNTSLTHKTNDPTGSFACDICSKVFIKSAYLYRHLRKHTGEFTCVNCLAVFARKENLQSHPCSRPVPRYPCHICGKKFSAKKYLQRHKPLHTGEFTCQNCKRQFVSKISLSCHRCPTDCVVSAKCTLCDRKFSDRTKLKAHLLHHSETSPDGFRSFLPSTQATRRQRCRKTKPPAKVLARKAFESLSSNTDVNSLSGLASNNESGFMQDATSSVKDSDSPEKDAGKSFICEICGSIFKSFSSMKTHRFLHGERRFECKTCGKRFHRKDVLQEHITVHQSPQLPCSECGKKFKTKKSLEVHMMIHAGSKRFTCEECGKEFYQKGNLLKHQRVHTPPADRIFPCQHCHKTFTSREYLSMHTLEHTQGKIFHCALCSKSFVKKHLLDSHQQAAHSNRAFLCRYCNNVMRHRHSARRHLEQQHPDKQSEWSQQGFVDSMLAQLPVDSPLLLNNAASHSGQLLSLRGQDIEPMMAECNVDGSGPINATSQSADTGESQQLSVEDMAAYALQQQVELLADPLLSSNQQLQLDEVNAVSIPFEQKKQGEQILLEVVGSPLQESVIVDQTSHATAVPISIPDNSVSKGDNAHVTIDGNTYILQDQVIFDQDEIASGDILLYVLDSGSQQ